MIRPVFMYPEGVSKCVTFSYDDGNLADRRLVEIFNRYKMKATFHLNSAILEQDHTVAPEEIAALYAGHEVSCHMQYHPFPYALPDAAQAREIWNDRLRLEELCGYPVRGMSYPYGNYDDRTLKAMEALGMEYSRTCCSTRDFQIPADFRLWNPTCHHTGATALLEQFRSYYKPLALFYVWGHSFEFDRQNNWEVIEDFCQQLNAKRDFWAATNIEVLDYLTAARSLRFSADCSLVYNPSALTVWFADAAQTFFNDAAASRSFAVRPGETLRITE